MPTSTRSNLTPAAGLSRAKVKYLRSLAEHTLSGELELERLDELDDERVIAELTAVKGLGLWSAQMFLMFNLGRPDVMPAEWGVRAAAADEQGRARIICDYIAGMTDRFAIEEHRKLFQLDAWGMS